MLTVMSGCMAGSTHAIPKGLLDIQGYTCIASGWRHLQQFVTKQMILLQIMYACPVWHRFVRCENNCYQCYNLVACREEEASLAHAMHNGTSAQEGLEALGKERANSAAARNVTGIASQPPQVRHLLDDIHAGAVSPLAQCYFCNQCYS